MEQGQQLEEIVLGNTLLLSVGVRTHQPVPRNPGLSLGLAEIVQHVLKVRQALVFRTVSQHALNSVYPRVAQLPAAHVHAASSRWPSALFSDMLRQVRSAELRTHYNALQVQAPLLPASFPGHHTFEGMLTDVACEQVMSDWPGEADIEAGGSFMKGESINF